MHLTLRSIIIKHLTHQNMHFRPTDSIITGVDTNKLKKIKSKGANLLDIVLRNRDDQQQPNDQITTFDQFKEMINKFDFEKNQMIQSRTARNTQSRMLKPKYSLGEPSTQSQRKNYNIQSLQIKKVNQYGSSFGGALQPSSGYLNVVREETLSRGSRGSYKKRSSFQNQFGDLYTHNLNINTNLNAGLSLTYKINQETINTPTKQIQKQEMQRENSIYKSSAHSSRSFAGNQQINQYQIIQKLGKGAFSEVHLCIDIATRQKYAMKIMYKKVFQKKLFRRNSIALADNYINNEIAILKKMEHPYIIKLYEVIEDSVKKKIFLILQYCSSGYINEAKTNLDIRISGNQKYRRLLQSQCKRYFKQISLGIDYIHNVVKIAHRDIKPENILLSEKDQVKISDFGLGTQDIKVSSKSGTKGYIPPEAKNPQYTFSKSNKITTQMADIWALGITLLVMLQGKLVQFQDGNQTIIQSHVNSLKDISNDCKDFILKCLKVDPNERINAAQILQHPWIMAKKNVCYTQFEVSKEEQEKAVVQRNTEILNYLTKSYIKLSI